LIYDHATKEGWCFYKGSFIAAPPSPEAASGNEIALGVMDALQSDAAVNSQQGGVFLWSQGLTRGAFIEGGIAVSLKTEFLGLCLTHFGI
jgi:hypothetical protein